MRRFNSFMGLVAVVAATVFSAQAQENMDVSQASVLKLQEKASVKSDEGGLVSFKDLFDPRGIDRPKSDYTRDNIVAPSEPMSARRAPRKVTSVNELAGNYVLTGESLLTSGYNGVSVTVEPLGTDSIIMRDFWSSGYNTVVKAKVAADGKLTIPYQVMGQHDTYGNIVFAATNLADGQPLAGQEVTGVVSGNKIVITDAWGAYVKASATATTWSYFSVVANTTLDKCNATFTGKKHGDGTTESYGVVVEQTGANVATIKNLGNYGQTVAVSLNRNKTVNIPSSLIAYNANYGDFYSYNLTFSETGSASLSTDDAVTAAATDLKKLDWTNWGVVTGTAQGSRYLVAAYDECNITCDFDLEYPSISVTDFEGEGTEASPFLIKQRDDMILLSDKVAGGETYEGVFFKVVNDIDMDGYKVTPVGNNQNKFNATFDGDNHTISNYVVDDKGMYMGLFGYADAASVIKNLTVDGAEVKAQNYYSGIVVAQSSGTLDNVHVVNSSIYSTGMAAGGLAGIAYNISNCSVKDTEITSLYGYTGGVAAEVSAPISNCFAQNVNIVCATVSGSAPGYPTGGVVGNLFFTTMDNCWFSGIIDGYSQHSEYQVIGGVAGNVSASTLKNSFAVGTIRGYASGAIVGGVVGYLRGNVEDSYFNGRVDGYSSRSTGGVVGRVQDYIIETGDPTTHAQVKNVYSAATVAAEMYQYSSQVEKQNNEVIGTIANGSEPVLANVYFDKQIVSLSQSEFGVNTADLTAAAGPAGFDASLWQYSAGKYPALKASAATAASKLATAAVVLPAGASFDKFTKDAVVNKDNDVIVAFYKQGNLSNLGYFAKLNGNKIELNANSEFGNDTIYYLNPEAGAYYRVAKISPLPFEGAGTEVEPFLIKTKADLILLSDLTTNKNQLFPETYFKIVNDIDLEYDENFVGICTNAPDAHNYFAGVIDGDGHFIHKMKFNRVAWSTSPEQAGAGSWGTINTSASTSYAGFVGRLDQTGVVKNVNIAADCDLKFYGTSGAVVAYNNGLVENCRNYSDVIGYSCWIGGISGQNLKEGKIINCYNAGNITGGYGQTAGIVGANYSYVEGCMNVGKIEIRQLATNYANQLQSCGGIAGTSSSGGKYVNCVNAGTVAAQIKRAGGIVGYWGAIAPTATSSYYRNDMINCVNYGTVFSGDAATNGAIAGGEAQSTSEEINGVYWDVQILDMPADANAPHAGMNGVETSVLTSGQALEGFDTEVWQFEAGKYPVLKQFASEEMVQKAAATQLLMPAGVTAKNLSADATVTAGTPALQQGTAFTLDGMTVKGIAHTDAVIEDILTIENDGFVKVIALSALPTNPLKGSGTAEDPWQLTNAQEWNALAAFMSNTANTLAGEYVKMMNDIDFAGEPAGITPLGADGVTAFNGNFDGDNFSVKGYAYKTKVAGQGGLFGTIGADATVKNLTAAGSTEGGLGGNNGTTKLGYVGGVVGKLYGKLENVKNSGKVTGIATYTAGIAAYAYQGARLDKVVNTGEVTSSAANVAGIAAYVYENVEFTECKNEGDLSSTTATAYVGGIASYALPGKYIECENHGNITGGSSAGIVANCAGKANSGSYLFDSCENHGDITGNGILGGITAAQGATAGNNVCVYDGCENHGDIIATATAAVSSSSMAGIAAFYSAGSTFDGCVNTGNIVNTKSVYTAGITGYYKGSASATYPVVVKNCVNSGNIVSQAQQIAGIIAYVSNYVAIDSCVNFGNIEQGLWGAAGICYTFTGANSSLTNCVNHGDVTVAQYNAGGIIGNNANAASVVNGNINTGNISSTAAESATSNHYGVGGIAGTGYATFSNCFNSGKVSGQVRVGGIVGSPSYYASAARTQLVNCVNIGEIEAREGCGGALVGTETGKEATYWGDNNTCTNSYYLTDRKAYGNNNAIGTGVTVAELAAIDMNSVQGAARKAPAQAWFKADDYTFAVPAISEGNPIIMADAAAVVLAEGDTYDNVTTKFYVGAPEGVVWTTNNDIVVINGNDADVVEAAQEVVVTLKATASEEGTTLNENSWTIILNVDVPTGIDETTIGKTIASEAYYTANGAKVTEPAAGQVYIVVRQYTDGTMKAIKLRK
ncbi:hypothetical protein [Sodaliphilus sp.]|uniref:hypothetical protein n=1 Tax=Sodaliphilus sp. TaxID=2815818 RepID=UPI00388E17A1